MKIRANKFVRVNTAIRRVEGYCSARLIGADDIANCIVAIEKRLLEILFKKDWNGLRFEIDVNAQNFPNAYVGIPESTQATVERGASGWFIVELKRDRCKSASNRIKPMNIGLKKEEIANFLKRKF